MERRQALPAASRAVLAAAVLVILLLAVAVASRADGQGGDRPLPAEAGRVAIDSLFYLLFALEVLGVLVMVWVLWPNPDAEALELPPAPRHRHYLAAMGLLAGAAMLLIWRRSHGGGRLPFLGAGPGAGAAGPVRAGLPALAGGSGGIDWVALAIVAGLLAAAGLAAWRALRPRRRPQVRAGLLVQLDQSLGDAIEDVIAEPDPRRAVIAAWVRTERLLRRAALARREPEAPLEYAARVLAAQGLGGAPVRSLAYRFEWARFSPHAVTPAMREAAIGDLRAIWDEVRAALAEAAPVAV